MSGLYCVYKHTTPNGKVYIGITRRKAEDRWQNGKGYRCNKHFTNAIKKYGWENIRHEILSSRLSEKEAKEMERFFVWLYRSYDSDYGYNKTYGGDDAAVNIERAIIQYSLTGEYVNEFASLTEAARQTRTNISRISDCANGKRFTTNGFIWLFKDDSEREEKLKEKIRQKRHPSAMCGGANHQARPIEQYSMDGTYIATYLSAQDAANALNIDYSSIKSSASLKKEKHVTSGGYIWIHSDDPDKKRTLEKIVKRCQTLGCEKPVFQYSLDGEFIYRFSSLTDAANALGKNALSSHIGDVCRGRRKTAYGYKWTFAGSRT